jgi:hypothetical protein
VGIHETRLRGDRRSGDYRVRDDEEGGGRLRVIPLLVRTRWEQGALRQDAHWMHGETMGRRSC